MSTSFFETDQTKLAMRLWTAMKKGNIPLFDVIQFSQNWRYADDVLAQCLQSPDQLIAQTALQLLQLRETLVQQDPEKARKLGARIDAGQNKAEPTDKASKDNEPLSADAIKAHYLKGLR